jgi:hypothetical protein
MTMPAGVMKVNRQLAELLGWQNVVDVGGMLLGRPPEGAPDSRDQAPVPNWAGSWAEAGPLAMRLGFRVVPELESSSIWIQYERFYYDERDPIDQTAPFAIAVMACRQLKPALDPWRLFDRVRGLPPRSR